jgi:hypothetical protein
MKPAMPRWQQSIAIIIFALVAASVPARAQDWSITTADLHTQPAIVRALSGDGIRFTPPGSSDDRTIPLDQFVSAQRTAADSPPTAKFVLLLSTGDRLTGEPAGVESERLTWRSAALGEIPVPLQRLVAMGRGGDVAPPDEPPKQDLVTLANGDSVSGVVTNCTAENVTVQTDNGATDVPIASVTRVTFAAVAARPTPPTHGFRIKLADGSAVTTADASFAGEKLTVSLDGKSARTIALRLSDVMAIEQLNGPVSWLSSRSPTENVQTPYFGGTPIWPARSDTAVDGAPLRLGTQVFEHGIGVHSYSRLTYAIDPGWAAFRTQYAIDYRSDALRTLADVTVRIKLDDKVVHEQSHVRAGALSSVVLLDLNAAKALTLEVDYGDAGDTQDHLNWIEPVLLRVRPNTAAATKPTTAPTSP